MKYRIKRIVAQKRVGGDWEDWPCLAAAWSLGNGLLEKGGAEDGHNVWRGKSLRMAGEYGIQSVEAGFYPVFRAARLLAQAYACTCRYTSSIPLMRCILPTLLPQANATMAGLALLACLVLTLQASRPASEASALLQVQMREPSARLVQGYLLETMPSSMYMLSNKPRDGAYPIQQQLAFGHMPYDEEVYSIPEVVSMPCASIQPAILL